MIYLLVASWGLIPRFFFTVQPDWEVNAINNPQFLGGNALGLFVRKNASEKLDELLMNCFPTTSLVSSSSLLPITIIIIVAIAIINNTLIICSCLLPTTCHVLTLAKRIKFRLPFKYFGMISLTIADMT